jgi:hypothetical protein
MGKENRCHACNLNDVLEVRDVRITDLEAEVERLKDLLVAGVIQQMAIFVDADDLPDWAKQALPLYRERFKEE